MFSRIQIVRNIFNNTNFYKALQWRDAHSTLLFKHQKLHWVLYVLLKKKKKGGKRRKKNKSEQACIISDFQFGIRYKFIRYWYFQYQSCSDCIFYKAQNSPNTVIYTNKDTYIILWDYWINKTSWCSSLIFFFFTYVPFLQFVFSIQSHYLLFHKPMLTECVLFHNFRHAHIIICTCSYIYTHIHTHT